MSFAKKLITKFLLKVIDPEIIALAIQDKKIPKIRTLCDIENSAVIYSTCEIQNRQSNPKKIRILSDTHIRGNLMIMGYGGEIEIGSFFLFCR